MPQDTIGHYPRPQMVRDRWIDLQGPWDFTYDDANTGLDEHWERRDDVFRQSITVPFPPSHRRVA